MYLELVCPDDDALGIIGLISFFPSSVNVGARLNKCLFSPEPSALTTKINNIYCIFSPLCLHPSTFLHLRFSAEIRWCLNDI